MGDKQNGPGLSLAVPLAGRTKYELPDLPESFHKIKQRYLILTIYLRQKNQKKPKKTFTLEWDLHRLLSQMSFF